MSEQKDIFNKNIESWIKHKDKYGRNNEQLDDILIIGIRL